MATEVRRIWEWAHRKNHPAPAVIEREPHNLHTVLELVDPPDTLKVGGKFRWGAANSVVKIVGIASPRVRPSTPKNVCVYIEIMERSK